MKISSRHSIPAFWPRRKPSSWCEACKAFPRFCFRSKPSQVEVEVEREEYNLKWLYSLGGCWLQVCKSVALSLTLQRCFGCIECVVMFFVSSEIDYQIGTVRTPRQLRENTSEHSRGCPLGPMAAPVGLRKRGNDTRSGEQSQPVVSQRDEVSQIRKCVCRSFGDRVCLKPAHLCSRCSSETMDED